MVRRGVNKRKRVDGVLLTAKVRGTSDMSEQTYKEGDLVWWETRWNRGPAKLPCQCTRSEENRYVEVRPHPCAYHIIQPGEPFYLSREVTTPATEEEIREWYIAQELQT